jgi:hypothetical protein
MIRWGILAAVVVAISGAITILPAFLNGDSSGVGVRDPYDIPAQPQVKGPQPKIVVVGVSDNETPTFDFGTMAQHTQGEHGWKIRNEGEADLGSTCSCTVPNFGKGAEAKAGDSTKVAPNQEIDINLVWNTRDFLNEYHKSASFTTSDILRRPQIEFHVRGNVYPPIATRPEQVGGQLAFEVQNMSTSEPSVIEFAAFSPDKPDLAITDLKTARREIFELTTAPMSADDRKALRLKEGGLRVKLTIKAGLPVGPFREHVVLVTNHPQRQELPVLMDGRVVGPITPSPDKVRNTRVAASKGATQAVILTCQGTDPVSFEVKDAPKPLEVKVEPLPATSAADTSAKYTRYRVDVRVPPDSPAGVIEGSIVLRTSHPAVPEMVIPVFLIVQPEA